MRSRTRSITNSEKLIAGFKAMALPDSEPTRGVIYGGTIFSSPCKFASVRRAAMRRRGRGSRFIFRRDLPNRAKTLYTQRSLRGRLMPAWRLRSCTAGSRKKAPVSNLEKTGRLDQQTAPWCTTFRRPIGAACKLGKLKVTLSVKWQKELR